jgi:hypothetical protein
MPGPERPVQRAEAERVPGRRRLAAGPRRVRSAMEITRKTFVSGAAIGLAGLTFFPAEAIAADLTGLDKGAASLRLAVGQTFYAQGANGVVVPLVLDRSVELGSSATTEQFTLYFRTSGSFSLTEGAWRLVTSTGRGSYDVFLVPTRANRKGGSFYRADFCLLKAAI